MKRLSKIGQEDPLPAAGRIVCTTARDTSAFAVCGGSSGAQTGNSIAYESQKPDSAGSSRNCIISRPPRRLPRPRESYRVISRVLFYGPLNRNADWSGDHTRDADDGRRLIWWPVKERERQRQREREREGKRERNRGKEEGTSG